MYQRRLSDPERSGIPLVASTDADASAVFWFVKDRFIGRGVPGEPLVWHPGDGAQMLRVVDNRAGGHAEDCGQDSAVGQMCVEGIWSR